jgi:hypothetical protein
MFQRDLIEPLEPDEVFRVETPVGAFEMSKSEFHENFPGVIQSESYLVGGKYHYPVVPVKAKRFLVEPQPQSHPEADRTPHARSHGLRGVLSDRSSQHSPLKRADLTRWASDWVLRMNLEPESAHYLSNVALWRNAFRPHRVRILLVAESHVAEQPGDVGVRVESPVSVAHGLELPDGFCRLVYCLGYGESEICHPKPTSNPGTWQFWDLFGAIAGVFDKSLRPRCPRRKESTLEERLGWKHSVLCVLRDAGVWLADASVLGLYASGRPLPRGVEYQQLIKESFQSFVWPDVAHDKPVVWVVGRGVGEALSGLPMIDSTKVISQPQDRDAERYREDLLRMVRDVNARQV